MTENKLPYISVIITAYNRKEYLLDAIKSVLNQTLDKKYYEIIVVENFGCDTIDDFINKNNIKNILSDDTTLRGKIYEALYITTGEIISFLDDDDIFSNNKLEIVYNKFKNNNITYYHNDNIPINEEKKILNSKKRNNGIDYNLSSISIRKSIIKIEDLNKINMLVDTFMYLCALESNNNIIKGNDKLTYYMFHNSISHIVAKNFEEYKKYHFDSMNTTLNSLIIFKKMFNSKNAINYLNTRITDIKIDRCIYGLNEKPENLTNYIKNNTFSLKHRTKLFSLYIFTKIYPNFRKYFYKKVWNNYREKFVEQ